MRNAPLRLAPHRDHVTTAAELLALCRRLKSEAPDRLLVADLFSGAGGLSHGLENAGMKVVLGADHYAEANETHAHHFAGMSVDWDLSDMGVVEEIAALMREAEIDVLAGGPPCQPFSKAGRSGIRHRVRLGLRDPKDARRDLWRAYLEVVRLAMPRAVIMENVPDMALDREMFILRSMVLDLEHLGYSVYTRIVQTSDYGVPQFRQRLILVALRENLAFSWPESVKTPVKLRDAIEDLPAVEGGWDIEANKNGFQHYSGPQGSFQRAMRRGMPRSQASRVYDHITRPVRDDDARAFDLMSSETRYSDLPEELRRYRADIFDDKYKRLDYDQYSRTITAHIAKDGYWYIHPEQNRTITVREAARIQTFPDHFRFAGTPTAAFKQIGNAVPPRLGEAVGTAVVAALAARAAAPLSREQVSDQLNEWWSERTDFGSPWLKNATRWQIIAAETLLDRTSRLVSRSVWPLLRDMPTPQDALAERDALVLVGGWINRRRQVKKLLALAQFLVGHAEGLVDSAAIDEAVSLRLVGRSIADVAMLGGASTVDDDEELPVIVNQAILRPAARYADEMSHARNKNSDGRLAVARLIGFGAGSRVAHTALLEIGREVCTTQDPACGECPLQRECGFAATHARA